MKTKVFPVESISNNHPFDPQFVKYEFNRKIDYRLSIMKNRRKVIKRHDNSSAFRGSKAFTKVYPVQKASIFTVENVTVAELLQYVDTAMKLQQDVCEAAIATNRANNVQLLLIFLESFISFIFNCYYLISVIAEPSAFKLPQAESMRYLSQHLFQPCFYVIITVMGFSMIQHKFQDTQRIVNKIIIHAQDRDVRTRFSAFSQQVQSNIPHFNVYRFFKLDGSVLFSMISATTTYLIILVQTLGSTSKVIPSLSSHFHNVNRTP